MQVVPLYSFFVGSRSGKDSDPVAGAGETFNLSWLGSGLPHFTLNLRLSVSLSPESSVRPESNNRSGRTGVPVGFDEAQSEALSTEH